MRTEPKALYRTVQYKYAYHYTPNMNVWKLFKTFIFELHLCLGLGLIILDSYSTSVHPGMLLNSFDAVVDLLFLQMLFFFLYEFWPLYIESKEG